VLVAAVGLIVRLAVFLVNARPLFMSDSGEYLEVAHTYYLPADRPIGVSAFFKVVLVLSHDLRAIVVAHSLLGVAAAVLTVIAARLIGVRGRFATAAGLAVAVSPTMLVYERLILAEALVVFLTVLAIVLFLSALHTGRFGRAIVAGVVVGLIATVRSNNAVVGAGLALIVLSAEWALNTWTRLGLVVALVFGAAVPVVGYAAMNYADSHARLGEGTFTLANFDGIALFARVAHLTDCTHPDRPPAIRAEVCAAGDDYLGSEVDQIVWNPGPVNTALGSPDVGDKNAQLRRLALETIGQHPWTVLSEGIGTAWDDLVGQDLRYKYRAADAGYAGVIVGRYFGAAEAQNGDDGFSDWLQGAYGWWIRLRPLVWLGLLAAIVVGLVGAGRPTRMALLGIGTLVLPVGIVAIAGAPGPRYVAPYEFIGFLGVSWLAQAWFARHRPFAAGDGREDIAAPRRGDDALTATAPPV